MKTVRLALFLVVATCSSCGGGGGGADNPTPPDGDPGVAARGLYIGTRFLERTMTLLVLGDGTYWGIYAEQDFPDSIDGAFQGTLTVNGAEFSSNDGRDFMVVDREQFDFTLTGTFAEMASINGSIGPAAMPWIRGVYSNRFEIEPSLTAIEGDYVGSITSARRSSETVILSIASTGDVSGSQAFGCEFSGLSTPRNDGNAYDLSITSDGPLCEFPEQTLTGIAISNESERSITAILLTEGRGAALIFRGSRP